MTSANPKNCASAIEQNGHNTSNGESTCPVKTSKKLKETYERLYEKAEKTLKKLENEGT